MTNSSSHRKAQEKGRYEVRLLWIISQLLEPYDFGILNLKHVALGLLPALSQWIPCNPLWTNVNSRCVSCGKAVPQTDCTCGERDANNNCYQWLCRGVILADGFSQVRNINDGGATRIEGNLGKRLSAQEWVVRSGKNWNVTAGKVEVCLLAHRLQLPFQRGFWNL